MHQSTLQLGYGKTSEIAKIYLHLNRHGNSDNWAKNGGFFGDKFGGIAVGCSGIAGQSGSRSGGVGNFSVFDQASRQESQLRSSQSGVFFEHY